MDRSRVSARSTGSCTPLLGLGILRRTAYTSVVERFIRTLREECLDLFWFKDPEDLQRKLSVYRQQYNLERYHSTLGMTPAQRAEQEQDRARIAKEEV